MQGMGLSHVITQVAEAEPVRYGEGNTNGADTRGAAALPGSMAISRMKGTRRNLGSPVGGLWRGCRREFAARDNRANVEEATPAATGAGVGAAVGGGAGLLAGLGLLAIPGLGPVVAAGWFASTALGIAAGSATGGIIGALVGAGTPEAHAHVYSEAVRRGGTLVTVRSDLPTVAAILDQHSPIDPVIRRNEYEEVGWKELDPKAPPYKPDAAEIERMRRPYK